MVLNAAKCCQGMTFFLHHATNNELLLLRPLVHLQYTGKQELYYDVVNFSSGNSGSVFVCNPAAGVVHRNI